MTTLASCAGAIDIPICQRVSILIGAANNAHDDLFVLVGAVIGAAVLPFLVRILTGGAA